VINPRKAGCFWAVFLIAFVPLALAQGTYTQIDVPGAVTTYPSGIDGAGDVTGWYYDTQGTHGFLLSGGTYTTLDYPGASNATANGINDLGKIVGYTYVNSAAVGFLYDIQTQAFTQINYPGAQGTFATNINNAGAIVGAYYNRRTQLGFEQLGAKYRQIAPPGAAWVNMYGVTDSGAIYGGVSKTGSPNFRFIHGTYKRVSIPNAPNAIVYGVNLAGTVLVGVYNPSPFVVAGFLYQNKILTKLEFPGATMTEANGVNDAGAVVGRFYDANGGPHGYIWTPSTDAAKK
jgi:probable HAF family extracellular repeat protein